MTFDRRLGLHLPAGAASSSGGAAQGPQTAHASVHAPDADWVDVCLFDRDDSGELTERRTRLAHYAAGTHFGEVPDVRPGQLYALRAGGAWNPEQGLRFNENKLLLDPYAQAISGEITWGQPLYAHAVDEQWHPVDGRADRGGARVFDPSDNAGSVPLGVVVPELPPANRELYRPWSKTVIYEAHLKGLTAAHPGIEPELRGTWAGLAHPAIIEHLVGLGVTAIELLPVFARADEPHLVRQGLVNYWGYNHLSFFAPEPSFATAAARAAGPLAVIEEIRTAIDTLHAAGLEVLLDVVYNHTAEGGVGGPTFSWRGLGDRTYYRLDNEGRSVDYTGTGNTLDFGKAMVCRLTLDSLRHWVQTFGVDGFRFDLAPVLGRGDAARGREGYDPDHPLLVAMRSDPVLSQVKLIAEPWDVGPFGWRTGEFPPPFGEWNDRFRDDVRGFWVADRPNQRQPHPGPNHTDLRDLATRMAGSSDLFGVSRSSDHLPRPAWASVNFITAHDGFTLEDLVSYNGKHNLVNGEDNRDGTDNNRSWNHGVDGRTASPAVLAARHQTRMALLSTLILSVGTPMLVAGDELGRTQYGNNNPYSQDKPAFWVDWRVQDDRRANGPARRKIREGVTELLRLRATYSGLSRFHRPDGREVRDGEITDVGWFTLDGRPMTSDDWHDSRRRGLQMALDGHPYDSTTVLLVINGSEQRTTVTLPGQPWSDEWVQEWDSASFAASAWTADVPNRPRLQAGATIALLDYTVSLFVAQQAEHQATEPS